MILSISKVPKYYMNGRDFISIRWIDNNHLLEFYYEISSEWEITIILILDFILYFISLSSPHTRIYISNAGF